MTQLILAYHSDFHLSSNVITKLLCFTSACYPSNAYRYDVECMSCINKIIDWIVILKYPEEFRTSDLQFAYKKNSSTSMCTLAMKEVAKYYTSRNGRVYCCLLDASKAFDRVRFDKLFSILQKRNVPSSVIRLMLNMYTRQQVRACGNGSQSDTFEVLNGVRQGGVISPILFTVYMDELLDRLECSGFGCYVGHVYMGSLCSADDLSLLAPTLYSLQRLVYICEEFGVEFDILFNARKTASILFNGRYRYVEPPNISLNGTAIPWQKSVKHLGNIVSCDLSEKEEIHTKQCDFIGRTNSIIAKFKGVNRRTLSKVFVSQCCHYYGCQAWSLDDNALASYYTCWRKGVRKLWYIPNIARSPILPLLVESKSMENDVISRIANMYNVIHKGYNLKLLTLLKMSIDFKHMGIMGTNIRIISDRWRCGYELLVNNNAEQCKPDIKARAEVIKEMTLCLEKQAVIMDCDQDEVTQLRNYVASY